MYGVELEFNKDLMWESDWDGYEVGFPEVNIVGLYGLKNTNLYFYIDMDTNKILTGFELIDEDE